MKWYRRLRSPIAVPGRRPIRWPGTLGILALAGLVVIGMILVVQTDHERGCGNYVLADHDVPLDYCFRTTLQITNSTGGDLTDYPVRVVFPALAAISGSFMSPRAYDLRPVNSSNVHVEALLQDLDSNTAALWLHAPSLPDGATVTFFAFTGNNQVARNQGVTFTGSDELTITSHADFSITDELSVMVELEMHDVSAQDSTLLARHSGGNGYRLELIDDASTLKVRGQVNGAQLDIAYSSFAAAGESVLIEMQFDAPDLELFADGVSIGSTDTGLGSITTAAVNLLAGTGLSDGTIRRIEVHDQIAGSRQVVGQWWFGAAQATETSAVDPTYQGTFDDYSGNSHDADYVFTRSQASITSALAAFSLTSTSPSVRPPGFSIDVLGSGLDTSLTGGTGSPNPWLPVVGTLGPLCGAMGWPISMCYGTSYALIALAALGIATVLTGEILWGIFGYGLVLTLGTANQLYEFWWPLVLIAFALAIVAARKKVRAGG